MRVLTQLHYLSHLLLELTTIVHREIQYMMQDLFIHTAKQTVPLAQ